MLASNGSAIRVYCVMNHTCRQISGGWMRVTSLDMKESSASCPSPVEGAMHQVGSILLWNSTTLVCPTLAFAAGG